MKTLIRSRTTNKYLDANGSWTSNPNQAIGFADTRAIISAVQFHRLVSVEMVILMGEKPGKHDVVVGLADFGGLHPRPGTGESLGMS